MTKIVIVFGILLAGRVAVAQVTSSVSGTALAVTGVVETKANVAVNKEIIERFNQCDYVESPMSWNNIRQALAEEDAIAYVNTLRDTELETSNFDEVQLASIINSPSLLARKNNLDLRDIK